MYKKYRDKEVSAAAKGLIGLFREIAPSMLEKKVGLMYHFMYWKTGSAILVLKCSTFSFSQSVV